MNSHPSRLARQLLLSVQEYSHPAIAFSGGVDSAVVAAAAVKSSAHATAFIARSPSLPQGEYEAAQNLAAQIGISLIAIETDEFDSETYRANTGRRCYACKQSLYEQILKHQDQYRFDVILNGTNADDLGDYRPGLQAAAEANVISPLAQSGFTKQDVRTIAKHWGISVWDKPAGPCLASRIAYGLEVTPERLSRVDAAENYLRQLLDIRELRVRHEHHDLARIEIPPRRFSELLKHENYARIVTEFKALGFKNVTLDLAGFRSGSMNEVLSLANFTHSSHEVRQQPHG